MRIPDEAFCLASHVHVCVTQDGSVFLDLKCDKYFGLGREETELMAASVHAWPSLEWSANSPQPNEQTAERLCESLVERGLICRVSDVGSVAPASRA